MSQRAGGARRQSPLDDGADKRRVSQHATAGGCVRACVSVWRRTHSAAQRMFDAANGSALTRCAASSGRLARARALADEREPQLASGVVGVRRALRAAHGRRQRAHGNRQQRAHVRFFSARRRVASPRTRASSQESRPADARPATGDASDAGSLRVGCAARAEADAAPQPLLLQLLSAVGGELVASPVMAALQTDDAGRATRRRCRSTS